jgi:hypothetical protein
MKRPRHNRSTHPAFMPKATTQAQGHLGYPNPPSKNRRPVGNRGACRYSDPNGISVDVVRHDPSARRPVQSEPRLPYSTQRPNFFAPGCRFDAGRASL